MNYTYKSGKLNLESDSAAELEQLISKVVAATKKKSVSVIVPTYNEEGNIKRLIDAISESLEKSNYKDFEIVVVDDDSKDNTPKIMDSYAESGKVAAIHRHGVRGIFSAIRDGIRSSKSDTVVIMDADFSHPPSKIPELLDKMKQDNLDFVSGSRFKSGASIEAPFTRKFSTVLFNTIIRFLMGPSITDWTGGFHAMDKAKILQLKFRHKAKWGEFDLELLHRAKKAKLRMAEVPFIYNFREEGQSKSAENFSFLIGYSWLYGKRALQLRLLG
jgi:dolichol-phosphate mannosyltransferase